MASLSDVLAIELAAPVDFAVAESGTPAGDFPVLRGLGLTEEDLAALRRQGFVSREQRHPDQAAIHKLRYRIEGRQRTRYLGHNLATVDAVRRELGALQQSVKGDRQMRQVLRLVRRGLRRSQNMLAPLLAEQGYAFHGRVLRRRRQPSGHSSGCNFKPD